jgi:hypothetical protein
MRRRKSVFALMVLLMGAMSVCAFARGHSGGRGGGGGGGGHGFSHGAGTGTHAGRGSYGTGAPAGQVGGQRPFRGHFGHAGHVSVGAFFGTPLYAPLFYPAPSYYYSPDPSYIEQAPGPAYWYFCPQLNAYYPYVQECPGGWEPVLPQPSGDGQQPPG